MDGIDAVERCLCAMSRLHKESREDSTLLIVLLECKLVQHGSVDSKQALIHSWVGVLEAAQCCGDETVQRRQQMRLKGATKYLTNQKGTEGS